MNMRTQVLLGLCALSGLILGGLSVQLLVEHSSTSKQLVPQPFPSESQLLEQIQGLWQFPEHSVWIQVNSDGTLLQCRSNHGQFVALGKATLRPDGTLTWDIPIWGKETASLFDGKLLFTGPKGAFNFERPTRQPGEECRSRLGVN
jgi:hypothetical protein